MTDQNKPKRIPPLKPKREHIIPVMLEDEVSSTKKSEPEQNSSCEEDKTSINDTVVISDSDDNKEEPFVPPTQILPAYNVTEKIIIVYDCAKDESGSEFDLNGETFTPNDMIKRGLRFFLQNKHNIDERHEFALIIMNSSNLIWVKDFTNDISEIIFALDDIKPCESEDIIQLDKLFDLIDFKNVILDLPYPDGNIPPRYVVRTIFTYNRSFTIPKLNRTDSVDRILSSPYFTFDVLMTHEIPNSTNYCIKIFKELQSLDKKGFAYFFPVARDALQLHLAAAKLLSHPLQRPCQQIAKYTLKKNRN